MPMDPVSIRGKVAVDSPEKLNSLFDMVKKADSYYLQTIQNVLLVPLISRLGDALENREHSDAKIKTIEVVKLVLEKTKLLQVRALKTILIVLAKQTYDFQSAQLVANVSEELQIIVLECLEVANRRTSTDCVQEFYRDSSSQICQIMYSILLLLDKCDSREVKLKAIAALVSLLHVDDASDLDDIVLRSEIAGVVFFAVPMIWSSLSRLILNDPKIGRRVIERSLCALGRILCLIMEDDKVCDKDDKELLLEDFKALLKLPAADPEDSLQSVLSQKEKKRTPEWLRAAGKKLREPFQNLISLTGHEKPEIRKAIGVCCEQWIERCRRSLQDNIDTFTEILLILSEDEDPSTSQYFSQAIDDLQRSDEQRSFFVAVNRELIGRHLLRMSRIIHRRSAKEQFTALSLLKAQLKRMSDEDLVQVLSNGKTLDVFVMNLLLFVEYNSDNPELLKEEHTIRNYVASCEPLKGRLKPWEDFKYIDSRSSQIPLLLHETIKCLRGRTGTRILIEYLMEMLHNRPRNVAEILKILQLVMSSCSAEEDSEVLEKLADELLDERYWNLSYRIVRNGERGGAGGKEHLKVSEHTEGLYESSLVVKYVDLNQESANDPLDEYFVSPYEAKANVLVTCVLMETIAALGHKMGTEKFQQKIVFHTLFNLLANAGNSNFCIHSAGLFALTELSGIYRLQGIRELIMKNTDYVLFFVNQALAQRDRSESALDVVSVLLEFCSRDVLGYVELIVNRLLSECSKYYKMANLSAYLRIFGLFLKNLNWSSGVVSEEPKSVDEILECWKDVVRPKLEEEIDESNEEEDEVKENESPEKKAEVSTEVEIARQVMKVALKHISSKNLSEVIAAFETLTWGVAILKRHEDDLLPLVHQIWAPLSKRFTDESPLTLRQSLKMLITLADSAKEFIHRRTVDEVVPTLNRILRNGLVVVNKSNDSEGCGRFTQHFKLIQEILTNYHLIVMRLAIKQKHLDGILSSVAPYLSKNSPKLLSDAAREFFIALRSYDGAAVDQKLASCNYPDEL